MVKTCNDHSFLRLISLTGQGIRYFADQKLAQFDLTIEQFQIMKVTAIDHGCAQHELGQKTFKSPANVTRLLDRLEKKNLISRTQNPDDRRSTCIHLTKEGEALHDEVVEMFDGLSKSLLEDINEDKMAIAFEVLTKIYNSVENINEEKE